MAIDERGRIIRSSSRRQNNAPPPLSYVNNAPPIGNNPIEQIISGLGFGLLIIFQVITSPLWIFDIIIHPILVTKRAIKVIISTALLYPILIVSIFVDPLLLALWIISFGYFNTRKLIVIGKTENLHEWTTNHY